MPKPKEKPDRLKDGDGLFLWVSPSGDKAWQFRYKRDGRGQTTTFGKFPRISLAEARTKATEARKLAAHDEQITVAKQLSKLKRSTDQANTCELFSTAWITREARRVRWTEDYRG